MNRTHIQWNAESSGVMMKRLIFAVGSLIWAWVAFHLPYCWDDWIWGTVPFRFPYLDTGSNSRFVGNTLEVIMTHSAPAKGMILSVVYSMIPILTAKIIKELSQSTWREELSAYVVSNCLLWSMGAPMWRESFGWAAGAANFVISYFAVLIYVLPIIRSLRNPGKYRNVLYCLGFFILGVLMQLLAEHVTLVVVFISLLLTVYAWLYQKQKNYAIASLLAGNILGTVFMFANSIFTTLFSTGTAVGGYRELSFSVEDSLVKIVFRIAGLFIGKYVPLFYRQYALIPTTVLLICLCILVIRKVKYRKIGIAFAIADGLILLYLWGVKLLNLPNFSDGTPIQQLAFGVLTSDVPALTGLAAIWFAFEGQAGKRATLVCLWLAVPLLIAPLCATTVNQPRVFLASFGLLTVAAGILVDALLSTVPKRRKQIALGLLLVIFAAFGIYWGCIYHDIGQVTAQRTEAFSLAQSGQVEQISIYSYPHGQYLLNADIYNEDLFDFFGFYKIPRDVQIVLIPWKK